MTTSHSLLSFVALSALTLSACGGSSNGNPNPDGGVEPLYALSTLVWGETETTGYVVLSNTLDVENVTLSGAREFPGYVSIASVDGQLLVTTAETPTIERFTISDALEWQPRGEVSFLEDGVTDSGFYRQYIQRGSMAYAEIDVSQRSLWDPVEFALERVETDELLDLTREGLDLFVNYNRTYFAYDGAVVRPFSYHDQDWFTWAADSQLVVYDPATHAAASVIEAPCPGLDTISEDEEGNLYFSNWEYPALHALVGSGAAPCVARVSANRTLDTGWETDLRALTEGRHVVNFRYLRDGKAIAAVLHHEEYGDGFDFENAFENQDDFWDAAPQHHRLWLFDLTAGTAAPVGGLTEVVIPPSFSHSQIDGRVFVMREATDYSETTVYELNLASGQATERFRVPGSSYQWVRVR